MFKGHGGYINCVYGNNGVLDFSASINPLGYPETVKKVISKNMDSILHYPDIDCSYLRKYIATKIGHSADALIVGNGSTELFYLIPRTIRPVKGIVFQPTFSEFKEALKCSFTEVVNIMLNEDDGFRLEYRKEYFNDKELGMAILCNPNNPTGRLIEKAVILDMARLHPDIVFVVDEAFMDFVSEPDKYSVINEAGVLHNLIVVKSLTKFYGFPGLRIGYMVAHADMVKRMLDYKEPWTVNTLAQFAAVAALEDKEFFYRSREFMFSERTYLFGELSGINGFLPFKPAANYIFVRIKTNDVTSVLLNERLLRSGIVIRDCSNFLGLNDKYFRVAVRTREENTLLIRALKSIFNQVS